MRLNKWLDIMLILLIGVVAAIGDAGAADRADFQQPHKTAPMPQQATPLQETPHVRDS